MTNLHFKKWTTHIRVSEEYWFEMLATKDGRFHRRVEREEEVLPTAEDWAKYERALELWEELRGNPFFDFYGEEPWIDEPRPDVRIVYAETHEEWLERCRELMKDD